MHQHKLVCGQVLTQCIAHSDVCQCPSPSIGQSDPSPALDEVCPAQDSLHHPYVATVAAGGTALPTIQRGLEPVKHEHTLVGSPPPVVVPVGVDAPSPATRFLSLLHEELWPSLYILSRDSEGFLIDPLRTIVVTFRSGDPNASLLSLITQESLIQTPPPSTPMTSNSKLRISDILTL